MKKLMATFVATLMVASFTATAASAKKKTQRGYQTQGQHYGSYGMQRGSRYTGGNAALSGNNGNSGQGSNSLGHIQGGNIGGGK